MSVTSAGVGDAPCSMDGDYPSKQLAASQLAASLSTAQLQFSDSLRSVSSFMSKMENSFAEPPSYSPMPMNPVHVESAELDNPAPLLPDSPPPTYRSSDRMISEEAMDIIKQMEKENSSPAATSLLHQAIAKSPPPPLRHQPPHAAPDIASDRISVGATGTLVRALLFGWVRWSRSDGLHRWRRASDGTRMAKVSVQHSAWLTAPDRRKRCSEMSTRSK